MRWLAKLRVLWRTLRFRNRRDRELQEELQSFLEMQTQEALRGGAGPREAQRRAAVQMGGVEKVKESVRDALPAETLRVVLQDLRYGGRNLMRRPGFTAVAVLTLALGIAATTTVFSAIQSLLLRPLPFEEPHNLMLVWGTNLKDGQARDVISGPNFVDLQRQSTALERLAAFHFSDMPARVDGGMGVVGEMKVTPEFFSVLGVQPLLGRAFEAADGSPGRNHVAIVSYGFWQQRFGGDPGIVGRTLEPLGQPHTIIGVLPPGFLFFYAPEVVTPLVPSELEKDSRTHYHYWVVGRLSPSADREQAEADLDGVMARLRAGIPALRNWEVTVEPLNAALAEPVRPALLALLGAAGLLLAIACANVASLLLARGMDRRWELSIRTALGASRARLLRQLLTENLLLAAMAGAVGTGGARLLIEGLALILPSTVAIANSAAMISLPAIRMDAGVLLFAMALSGGTVLLSGLAPARRASVVQPADALRGAAGRATADRAGRRPQRALIVAETALAMVLIIGVGLMLRTMRELLRVDPGFLPRNVGAMYVGPVEDLDEPARARFYQAVVEKVRAVQGVAAAALNDYILLQNEDDYEGFVLEGRPLVPGSVSREEWRRVSTDYFRTMGIALASGRDFTDADNAESPSVAIVNRAMARKYWPGEDPVGKRILITSKKYQWTEVIGLAGDERTVGIGQPAKPMLYVPFHRAPRPAMGILVRTEGDPGSRLRAIQQAVWSVDPTRPVYSAVRLEKLVADSISVQRLTLTVASALGAAAMLLTVVGIFGVVSYATARRTREIGIRAALGARPRDVLALVLRDGLGMVCAGVALGAIVASGAARALSGLLYAVTPTDPLTFIASAVVLLLAAGLACWLPARRAAQVDPVTALRYE